MGAQREPQTWGPVAVFCTFFMFSAYAILRPMRERWDCVRGRYTLYLEHLRGCSGAAGFAGSAFAAWSALGIRPLRRQLRLVLHRAPTCRRGALDAALYVWPACSACSMMLVFWSFMADIFSRPQATDCLALSVRRQHRRHYRPGAGRAAGGRHRHRRAAAGGRRLIALAPPLIIWLQDLKRSDLNNEAHSAGIAAFDNIGGGALAGFSEFLKSNYLLVIGLFLFLYTSIGSFVYFGQKNLLEVYDIETRSQILAGMDLVVNIFTILVGAFATGRIATHFGLPFTLASVPVLMVAGMLVLATMPVVAVVVVVQAVRRMGTYAISRPAREMLFTAVDRETRFKAKPVIDIVIYRGGDMLNAWAFTALTQGLGLGLASVAVVGAGVAALWAATGVYLGRRFNTMQEEETAVNSTAEVK